MTKEIILKTKKDLASYYMDREFAETNFEMLKELDKGNGEIEVQNPSDEYYLKEFLSCNTEYKEKIKELDDLDEEGNEDIKEEFETYRDEDDNYPMWNTVWRIKGSNWTTEYYEKNVDKLAEIGIGLLEFKDEYYLFIAGAGYNFYHAHWIPLFTKFFTWIDEDCGKELETIEIQNNKHAIFKGSEELEKSIGGSETDHDTTKAQGYIEHSLEDLKEITDIYENPYREELDLLISELEKNNIEYLRIEY